MATEKDFADFVKRQRVEKQPVEKFDPVKELQSWLGTLQQLYATIESYLEAYVSSDGIQIQYQDVELNEEFSGPYKARQMILKIGSQQVTLRPVGTMLIGSRGRVDVLGPQGRAILALVNKKATSRRSMISVTISGPGIAPQPKPEAATPVEWEWKIVSPSPNGQFTVLSKEAFQQLILEVANG
jgi:hypothetical protein